VLDLRQVGSVEVVGALCGLVDHSLELDCHNIASKEMNGLLPQGVSRHRPATVEQFVERCKAIGQVRPSLSPFAEEKNDDTNVEIELRFRVSQLQFRRALAAVTKHVGHQAVVSKTRKVLFPHTIGIRVVLQGHNQTDERVVEMKSSLVRMYMIVRGKGNKVLSFKGVASTEQNITDNDAEAVAASILNAEQELSLPLLFRDKAVALQPKIHSLETIHEHWGSLKWVLCSNTPGRVYTNAPFVDAEANIHIPFAVAVVVSPTSIHTENGTVWDPRYNDAIVRTITRYEHEIVKDNVRLHFSLATTSGRGVSHEIEIEVRDRTKPWNARSLEFWAWTLAMDCRQLVELLPFAPVPLSEFSD
jgi:hypothetical protein